MEIRFKNTTVRELCEKRAIAIRKLGEPVASKLRKRLADLEAARTAGELVAGRPHPLKGDRAGHFAVDLAGGWRLVFSAANDPIPARPDASTDWTQVTIVCIDYIGDYHD